MTSDLVWVSISRTELMANAHADFHGFVGMGGKCGFTDSGSVPENHLK